MVVYKITNIINQKVYIGITRCDINKRVKQHIYGSSNKSSLIHKAIIKYGFDKFSVDIIDRAITNKELIEKEKKWIIFYNSCVKGMGYNLTNGGQGCRTKRGYKLTDLHIEKLRAARNANPKIRHTTPHSEETKKRLSCAKMGFTTNYNKKISKPVLCSTNNTKYNSIGDAAKKTGAYPQNILKVLKGERSHTLGLHFKFITNG